MKAQHALGLNLSWTRVTPVFLLDIAILVLAGRWPGDTPAARYAWWSGVGIAALITIITLVTYRRVPLSTMSGAWLADQFADPEKALSRGRTQAVNHQRRYGHGPVGIREYEGRLVTMIAVGGRQAVTSGRHHQGSEAVALPVEMVAAGLRQFDVRLESIDIVSVGTRANPGDAGADPEDGAEPSFPDHRATWVVLRMNPQGNVNAVAARDSLAATLAAATERLAEELNGRDVSARVVPAEEFDAVDAAVLADVEPGQLRHRLFGERSTGYVSSFWVSPRDIEADNLEHLWVPEADAAVVTVRLAPGRGRTTEITVLVRYHSADRLHKSVRAALNGFVGRRRLEAFCASLPAASSHPGLTAVPGRELRGDEHLPISLDPMDDYTVARPGARI